MRLPRFAAEAVENTAALGVTLSAAELAALATQVVGARYAARA